MNIRSAILPHKHLRFSASLLGVAGMLRTLMVKPATPEQLWVETDIASKKWRHKPTYTQYLLALNALFALQLIDMLEDGMLVPTAPPAKKNGGR